MGSNVGMICLPLDDLEQAQYVLEALQVALKSMSVVRSFTLEAQATYLPRLESVEKVEARLARILTHNGGQT